MNKEGTLKDVVRYWIGKAEDSLSAAYDELKVNRLSFSVNGIYYACFYAVSAVLFRVIVHPYPTLSHQGGGIYKFSHPWLEKGHANRFPSPCGRG